MARSYPDIASSLLWIVFGLELTSLGLQVSNTVIGMTTSGTILLLGLLLAGWVTLLNALHSTMGSHDTNRWTSRILLVLTITGIVLWSATQVLSSPNYGTDEAALDQWAAMISLHGINPYAQSLRTALHVFSVPMSGRTFLRNGQLVSMLSYPALAFEFYWPFLLLGWTTQLAIALNVALWVVTVILLFSWMPNPLKPITLIVALCPLYLNYVISGFSVILALPLVVWAARRLPDERRNLRPWFGSAILFGLAAAVNQLIWLMVPFVVAAQLVPQDLSFHPIRWRWLRALEYCVLSLLAFILPNLPWVIRNMSAWWHGILYPVTAPLMPAGQGWVSLVLAGHGTVGKWQIGIELVFLLGLLALNVRLIDRWENLTFFLPGIVLFWASRSFSLYWTLGIIPSLALLSSTHPNFSRPAKKPNTLTMVIAGLVMIGIGASFLPPSLPISLKVVGWSEGGPNFRINQLTVRLHNTSQHPISPPILFVRTPNGLQAPWDSRTSSSMIPAGATRQISLRSRSFNTMIPNNVPFRIVAINPSGLIRVSSLVNSRIIHLGVAEIKRSPRHVTIQVFVLGEWDQRLRRAGFHILLSQVDNTPSGTLPGTAWINSHNQGQSPVGTFTNKRGVATFDIRLPTASPPLTFQAYLVGHRGVVVYSSPVLAQ
jgi:hypothetical protein